MRFHLPFSLSSLIAVCLIALCGGFTRANETSFAVTVDGLFNEPENGQAFEPIVRHALEMDTLDEFTLTQTQPQPTAVPEDRVARASTRRRGRTYRMPSMFGDFFGGSVLQSRVGSVNNVAEFPFGGGAVRRVKIAENNSPVPHCRFIFNYNFFNDVFTGIGDVNRYTLGIEQAIFDGNASVSLMVPFGSTLDVNQTVRAVGAPATRDTNTQVGDLAVIFKTILWEREQFLLSGGVGVTAPIAKGSNVFQQAGAVGQVIDMEHNSVHLLPFLAMVRGYDSGWFWQAFLQLDVDVNGNPVAVDEFGFNPQPAGVLQDQTLLFADLGFGYWLNGNPADTGGPGVALTAEVHYSTTLQDADIIASPGVAIFSTENRYDVVNLTLGAILAVNPRITIRPAMVVPLHDDQFDFEAMVQTNIWR